MSSYLRSHESQHARPPCPSLIPRVHSDSRPSSQWCHPAISSSVIPFFSCPQSLLASKSFPMSKLFPWGGQSIRISASAWVLPMNIQNWFHLGWIGYISLQSKGLSRVFYNTTVQKHQFGTQLSSQSNSHIHTTTGKPWPWLDLLELTPKKGVLFIIGDWNAKVGSQGTPGVTGKFGLGIKNEVGYRLKEFCQENTLVITNTLFQQHKRWLYTWTPQIINNKTRLITFFLAEDGKNLYSQWKQAGSWLWLRSWASYCKNQT